ncbi:hypothetical protein [Hymenobacter convexus]|uniref:hypothetical protein n=1 Tax=Hymenobacter sp. CA1UV-4 TaxID=3063782 RepID=UPI002712A7D1|nr:hypothetical protein [Hymenobacter sp. CA1UV-4]MDO7852091.1 hypothetical protein [Hymenobacter sp. CA1UV-4]
MTIVELITMAIESRKPICFEYDGVKKITGQRFGHPYAVFLQPGTNNACVDIYQTHGVSHRGGLPDWRTAKIENISSVLILEEKDCFEIEVRYNPNSPKYIKVIKKV